MAEASGCELGIMLETIPLSAALLAVRPDVLDTRLAAATAGDDYQLLFTADPGAANDIRAIAAALNVAATPIGHAGVGDGITLTHRSETHTSELQSLMRISYAVFCLKQTQIEETII